MRTLVVVMDKHRPNIDKEVNRLTGGVCSRMPMAEHLISERIIRERTGSLVAHRPSALAVAVAVVVVAVVVGHRVHRSACQI
jgi:hypothetical protein